MTATQIYPSIAPLPITESDILYHPQHFDPQSQIIFQQQQEQQQQQQQQQQQHSYLDPTLAQHDLRIFTQGLAHNSSYGTTLAPYPASESSDGSMDLCGGVMNWVNGRSATMPTDPYLYNQSSPSAPPYALALTSPTQSLSPREPNAKRDASTAASARFRQKKKQREKILELNVKQQQEKIGMMECRIKELEGENGFLKELVMGRIKWKEEKGNEESNREEEGKEKDSGETE